MASYLTDQLGHPEVAERMRDRLVEMFDGLDEIERMLDEDEEA